MHDRIWYQEQLAAYKPHMPAYKRLADRLVQELSTIADSLDVSPIVVKGRAKSLESLAEKMTREAKAYTDPLVEITDFCAVRFVAQTLRGVEKMRHAVLNRFEVDWSKSPDKPGELERDGKVGYRSVHLVFRLKPGDSILVDPGLDDALRDLFARTNIELQIRTVADHAWADFSHELQYKSEFRLPQSVDRKLKLLSGELERLDADFCAIQEDLDRHPSNWKECMTSEQQQALIERLEGLLAVEPALPRTAHRLVKAYIAIDLKGRIGRIQELLEQVPGLASYPPGMRDIGVALTKAYSKDPRSKEFQAGLDLATRAHQADPMDIETLCCLGGIYKKLGDGAPAGGPEAAAAYNLAIDWYGKARRLDHSYSYPLVNVLFLEICHRRDLKALDLAGPDIDRARLRCLEEIESSENLPWAAFDVGFLTLFQGNPAGALRAFAKSIAIARHLGQANNLEAPRIDAERIAGVTGQHFGTDQIDLLLRLGMGRPPANWEVPPEVTLDGQLVILAGGCKGLAGEALDSALDLLRRGLGDFEGILVSGGTRGDTAGVAQIPGDLRERHPSRRTYGYLPATNPYGVPADDRNTFLRRTAGTDFSPLEPLVYWTDLLAKSGNPANARLLGFNGGAISAFEYELALALGARVGILKGSGGAADALLQDGFWSKYPGTAGALEVIEATAEAIRDFVGATAHCGAGRPSGPPG